MKFLGPPSSGSQAGSTNSRNRFGQYIRTRAVPVNPNTSKQANVRAALANNAAAWRGLTDAQRAAWASLGSGMTRTDALGQSYTLDGFMAYCSVNNLNAAAGVALVADAPTFLDPGTLASMTVTLTNAAFSVAYTATPLSTGVKLFLFASPQRSAGRSFEADYRLIQVSAAAAASPLNVLAAYSARLGAPVTGNRVFISGQLVKSGFAGSPFLVNQVVA